jgi:hypothetical protein
MQSLQDTKHIHTTYDILEKINNGITRERRSRAEEYFPRFCRMLPMHPGILCTA